MLDLNNFYGNPDKDGNGMPDIKWESENLTSIIPAFPMFWSWDLRPVKGIRIHKLCAQSLSSVLHDIGNNLTPHEIDLCQLNRCGGGYNFRLMRGANKLSVHSWGAAIDLSPEYNGLGVKWKDNSVMMPMKVVKVFEKHGWTWGGNFRRCDAMHFEKT